MHSINGVSIVIPLYNKVNHIGRCIESVHAQSCGDYEILVVDDGSTDGSPRVASQYLRPGDKLIAQSNQGPGSARQAGIKNCRHDLIAFLDADDAWLAGHLQIVGRLMERFGSADAFGTGYGLIRGPGKLAITVQIAEDRLLKGGDYFKLARPYSLLHSSNSVVRKCILDRIGGYPTMYRRHEDLVFTARLAIEGRIAVANSVTVAVHLDADNRTSKVRGQFLVRPWFEGDLFEYYKSMDFACVEKEWLRNYLASTFLYTAYYSIIAGDIASARYHLDSQLVAELGLGSQVAWMMLLIRLPRGATWVIRGLVRARLALLKFQLGHEVFVKVRRWPVS